MLHAICSRAEARNAFGRNIAYTTPTMDLGSDLYRQQILDHYRNPRNHGELSEPTFSHVGENTMCGDVIEMDVALDEDDVVVDVAFRGDGCAISQASASMLTERLLGMDLDAVDALTRDDIVEMLGVDISPMRVKCAVLAEKVVQDGAKIHRGELDASRTDLAED